MDRARKASISSHQVSEQQVFKRYAVNFDTELPRLCCRGFHNKL